VITCSE
jgi:WD40 repeat protein